MPVTEFVVAVRIWLGIPLFPTAQLCSCSSSIDSYGDHLLGCSYGPLRIRRHDALTRILFHSMLLDNPGVLREQRVFGDNQSRPGDLHHPDFCQGCPASLMFLYVTLSLHLLFLKHLSLLGLLLLLLGRLLRISSMRPMSLLQEDSFIP